MFFSSAYYSKKAEQQKEKAREALHHADTCQRLYRVNDRGDESDEKLLAAEKKISRTGWKAYARRKEIRGKSKTPKGKRTKRTSA